MKQKYKKEQKPLDNEPETGLKKINQCFHRVAVACSGGVDSTVLFHLLYQWTRAKKKPELAICHTNFGLRGKESDEDEKFLQKLAQDSGVLFFSNQISPRCRDDRRSESLQAWARRLRYEHFQKLSAQGWIIATAHHQNDVAENVLLRLARGTSPGAMAGLALWHEPYWRPLISYSKSEIEGYACLHQLSYREDSSNLSHEYTRNRIRHQLLPLLEQLYPGASGRIARCGLESGEITRYCCQMLELPILRLKEAGLALSELAELPASLQSLIISRAIGPAKKGRKGLSSTLLDKIRDHIKNRPTETLVLTLPAGRGLLKIHNQKLTLHPSP